MEVLDLSVFLLAMFRVRRSAMSAIDQFFKSLTIFFQTVPVTGIIFNGTEGVLLRISGGVRILTDYFVMIFVPIELDIYIYRNKSVGCCLVFSFGNIDILFLLKQSSCMFSSRSWTWEVGIRNLMFGYATGILFIFR